MIISPNFNNLFTDIKLVEFFYHDVISATFSLYIAGEKFVDQDIATIDISTKAVSYDLSPSQSSFLMSKTPIFDCRGEWVIDNGDEEIYRVEYYDFIPFLAKTNITDWDLIATLPALKQSKETIFGNVKSGTKTSFIDTDRNEPIGYFKSASVKIFTGSNQGNESNIISYDPVEREFNLEKLLKYDLVNGNEYKIFNGYGYIIDQSFREILVRLINIYGNTIVGNIADYGDIQRIHLFLSLANICKQRTEGAGDQYYNWMFFNGSQYESEFEKLRIKLSSSIESITQETRPIIAWLK